MRDHVSSPSRLRWASSVLVAATVVAIAWVGAGDLAPPPGAIQSTNRVQLNEQAITLPYTISQPGSYVLTSNLTGVAGQHGIVIDADDVALDLNGFVLTGVAGSVNGIMVNGSRKNIAIKNGTVRAWNGVGVEAFSAGNSRFENLRLSNNTLVGLRANDGSTITGCTAQQNGSGMVVDGCTVIGCAFALNTGSAIAASGEV